MKNPNDKDLMEDYSIIFHKEKKVLRIFLIIFFFTASIILFLYIKNIFLGSVSLFATSYFLGTFKTRSRIKIFKNEEFDSAIAEIRKLIDGATEEIRILCYRLNPEIYNQENILSSVKKAIDRRVKISVICNFSKMIKIHKSFIEEKKQETILKYAMNRSIIVYDIDKDLTLANHFLVADSKSFRFEEKHGESNDTRKAILVYNCDQAKKLSKLFEEVLKKDYCYRKQSDEIIKQIMNHV